MEQSGILGRAYSSSYPQIYIKKENIIIYIYTLFSVCHFCHIPLWIWSCFQKKTSKYKIMYRERVFCDKNQNERINQC